MKWELDEALAALDEGNVPLCRRYLEKALEQVRCMYCHEALTGHYVPYFKGFVHTDCARKYTGRGDYLHQHGEAG